MCLCMIYLATLLIASQARPDNVEMKDDYWIMNNERMWQEEIVA
jgi:hypothetical protein